MTSSGAVWPPTEGLPASVGTFILLEPLKTDGATTAYLAIPARLVRGVRLVVLTPIKGSSLESVTEDQPLIERIEALGRVRNANINPVWGPFHYGNFGFMASSYIPGLSLRQVLTRMQHRPMSVQLAAMLMVKVAAGVAALHDARGYDGVSKPLAHSDINPGNIIVGYDGSVQLIDFGFGRSTQSMHRAQVALLESRAAYLAPEDLDRSEASLSGDLYGLGVVLYQLVTGRLPFAAASGSEWSEMIRNTPAMPITSVRSDVPAAVGMLIMRLLSKEPAQRPSAREVVSQLSQLVGIDDPASMAEWCQGLDTASWLQWQHRYRRYLAWTWEDIALVTESASVDLASSMEDETTAIGISEPVREKSSSGLPPFSRGLSTTESAEQNAPVARQQVDDWLRPDTITETGGRSILDVSTADGSGDLTRVDDLPALDINSDDSEPATERSSSWSADLPSEDHDASIFPSPKDVSDELQTGELLEIDPSDDLMEGTLPMRAKSLDRLESHQLSALPAQSPPASDDPLLQSNHGPLAEDPAHRPATISIPDISSVRLASPTPEPSRWPSILGVVLLVLSMVGAAGLVARSAMITGEPVVLVIKTQPASLDVEVARGGRVVGRGRAPLSLRSLSSGIHDLQVKVDGQDPRAVKVDLPKSGTASLVIDFGS